MADISKIEVNNSTYDLKDATARSDISNIQTDLTNNYTKTSNLASVALSGSYNDLSNKPTIPTKVSELNNDSGFITNTVDNLTNYTKTSDLATVATTGSYTDLSNKPTIPDVSNFITKDVNDLTYYTKSSDLATVATSGSYVDLSNKPTIPPKMVILSYGSSTWQDFINAYNENAIVYCRASSNSNPAINSQTRLAFMAYVNNADNPTEVEFQYYRSVSSHSDSQQGDQVFVYKLTSSGTWTVTTREAYTKIKAGNTLTSSYASGTLTLDMNDSGWQNLTQNQGTWEYAKCRKIGKIVEIRGYITSLGAPSGVILTLPSGYAPHEYIYAFGANGWTTAPTLSRWVVTPEGTISLDWALSFVDGTNLTTNTWKRFSVTYMIE